MIKRTYVNEEEATKGIKLYEAKGYTIKNVMEMSKGISIVFIKKNLPFGFGGY